MLMCDLLFLEDIRKHIQFVSRILVCITYLSRHMLDSTYYYDKIQLNCMNALILNAYFQMPKHIHKIKTKSLEEDS